MTNFKILKSKHENISSAIEELKLLAKTKQVFICSGSTLSLPSIQRILTEHKCSSLIAQNINDIKNGYVGVCHYFIEKSFAIDTQHFFSEEAIFGKIVVSAKKKRDISAKKQLISANSYGVGDLVVHKKYGVAKFDGLLLVKSQNKEYDTVKLIYAGGDVLYVPVVNVDYVTKYGNVPEGIAIENLLDKLSGTSFATRKAKVKKNLFEIADALLKEAAKRKMVEASVFYENELTKKFDDKFLFILTDDQTLAIEDCREDLSSSRPMERLICGYVGFGKTEVAMRCCALVVFGRMVGMQYGQVCIICPTTLLAMQHYKTFQQRF